MRLRTGTVRHRVAALAACSIFVTILPLSAVAENGIPAGSGAVITAGQPLLVRITPGWDAEISYEIADGSYVTVWDVPQAAADGSLWYPVDGGFVPVDAVTSVATLEGGSEFSYFQEAAPATEEWVDPAATQTGWVDPATGEWVEPAATGEWVEPAATETGWVDPTTGEWVGPAAEQMGWVDPATGEWVDPAAAQTGWVDSTTGEWVDPAAAQTGWVDPASGEWVEPAAQTGWVDPTTGEWVDPAAAQSGWIDPNTGEWVNGVSLAQEAVAEELVAPTDGVVDPAAQNLVTDEWVDPAAEVPVENAPAGDGWVDPATGEWVEPVADEWTEPAPVDLATDPASNEWTEPAPVVEEPVADEWVEPAPVETGSSGDAWGDPIGTAYIAGTNGDGAACRTAAERGADKVAVLGEGEPVEVRGEAVGEWQPVNCAGMGGYVNTSFISWEPLAAVDDGGRRGRNRGDGGGGSGTGQQMANFAMQYVGYPYAYAGEGPYAFDCSGFTKFVAQNALGVDITHDMFTQIGMGQSVGMDELQPGDLVFFSNTFRPGLSHVGVYIGGGQFVHAENESTGVVVSDLNSDYYGSRWSGGTRLA